MSVDVLVPVFITTCVIVAGWYVGHRFTTNRDLANKRREMQVEYLIEAYRRLEFAGNRPLTAVMATEFEKAVADIQLFGTPRQVQLAQEFAFGFAAKGTHSLDPLLNELRQDLRRELNLEIVPPPIKYLRITTDNEPNPAESGHAVNGSRADQHWYSKYMNLFIFYSIRDLFLDPLGVLGALAVN